MIGITTCHFHYCRVLKSYESPIRNYKFCEKGHAAAISQHLLIHTLVKSVTSQSPVLTCKNGLLVPDPTQQKSFQIPCLSVDLFLKPYKQQQPTKV